MSTFHAPEPQTLVPFTLADGSVWMITAQAEVYAGDLADAAWGTSREFNDQWVQEMGELVVRFSTYCADLGDVVRALVEVS